MNNKCKSRKKLFREAVVERRGWQGLGLDIGLGSSQGRSCVTRKELGFLSVDNREPRDVFKSANNMGSSSF